MRPTARCYLDRVFQIGDRGHGYLPALRPMPSLSIESSLVESSRAKPRAGRSLDRGLTCRRGLARRDLLTHTAAVHAGDPLGLGERATAGEHVFHGHAAVDGGFDDAVGCLHAFPLLLPLCQGIHTDAPENLRGFRLDLRSDRDRVDTLAYPGGHYRVPARASHHRPAPDTSATSATLIATLQASAITARPRRARGRRADSRRTRAGN